MRNHLTAWTCLGLLLSCWMISGCQFTPVQIGPQEKETITILHPGRPIKILRNCTVDARPLKDEQAKPAKVDVGGWIAMPPDHWDAVTLSIQQRDARIKELQAELAREKVPVDLTP
jgi:hypothetical protein